MENFIKGFIAPHIRDKYGLCQDSFFVDQHKLFFAVADGVSSSFSPTYYAKLVSSFYENESVSLEHKDAIELFGRWKTYMENLLKNQKLGRGSLQRYKRGEYPCATYGRFNIKHDSNGDWLWNAAVLGDCSIIHLNIHEKGLIPIHVILSGNKFLNDKYLYNSDSTYYKFGKLPDQLTPNGDFLDNEACLLSQNLKKGDRFLLMSDGISDWVLKDSSKIEQRIQMLLSLESQCDFIKLIEKERKVEDGAKGREMENDDITLLIIGIDDISSNICFSEEKTYITDIDQRIEFERENNFRVGFSKELEEQISDLENQVDLLKRDKSYLEDRNKQSKDLVDNLQGQIDYLTKEKKELEDRNKQSKGLADNLQGQIDSLTNEKKSLETQNKQSRDLADNLQDQIGSLTKEKNALEVQSKQQLQTLELLNECRILITELRSYINNNSQNSISQVGNIQSLNKESGNAGLQEACALGVDQHHIGEQKNNSSENIKKKTKVKQHYIYVALLSLIILLQILKLVVLII